MENTLTVAELKRRGMAAIEDGLRHGPVRILKRNKAAAVVLSEAEYEHLVAASGAPTQGMSAMEWLLAHSACNPQGKRSVDRRLREERDW